MVYFAVFCLVLNLKRTVLFNVETSLLRAILKKEFRTLMKGMKGNISSYANIMMELKKCANHAELCAYSEEEPARHERLSVIFFFHFNLFLFAL